MYIVSLHNLDFFFNDTATTEIYTLSLHDALPISTMIGDHQHHGFVVDQGEQIGNLAINEVVIRTDRLRERTVGLVLRVDRKSTRLNSSHANISYAVFCLKKKNIYF